MKTEYTEEIKALLENNYDTVDSIIDSNEYTERKTLSEIHAMITAVLPAKWIYESDIYEVLGMLGFKSFLYAFPEVKDENEKVLVPERTALYYFLRKKTASY